MPLDCFICFLYSIISCSNSSVHIAAEVEVATASAAEDKSSVEEEWVPPLHLFAETAAVVDELRIELTFPELDDIYQDKNCDPSVQANTQKVVPVEGCRKHLPGENPCSGQNKNFELLVQIIERKQVHF